MKITGIQQIGIGIPDVNAAFKFYRQNFGMDVPVFEEAAEANLMLPYTGGKPHDRHAILALNMQGGSGFEIWQYTSRTPEKADFEPQLGDLGIFICKLKSKNVANTFEIFKQKKLNLISDLETSPDGKKHFFVKDPYENIFQIVEDDVWLGKTKAATGGAVGATLGVSNIENSLELYKNILGYDKIIYDETNCFEDLKSLPNGNQKFRRILLKSSKKRTGGFAPLFGNSQIELIQAMDYKPKKIFENRFWGDLGFIHLCFDIIDMNTLREKCKASGFPFTVDSLSAHEKGFDMGEAAGNFSYIEDPDGTLIEFVETLKIPLVKKLNWYLDLRKRGQEKDLPKWMIKALRFNRVKD